MKEVTLVENFGEFLKKHRIASGYKSQRRLAEKSNVSSATISRIESGKQRPELRTIQAIAPFLRTTSIEKMVMLFGESFEKEIVIEKETIDLARKEPYPFELAIDGKPITDRELTIAIELIRTLRTTEHT